MKDKLTELYPEVAKQYEEDLIHHILYTHDESATPVLKGYCLATSLYPLMYQGVGNIDGITPTPPNDLQSFSGQITNLVFLLSSQFKGAVAIGEYFVALNYYAIQEFGKDWHKRLNKVITSDVCKNKRTVKNAIHKAFKQFIYGVNQPAGNRSYQSPFSNISYFDHTYFTSLFKEFYYPDGTQPEWEAIDCLQRLFMKFFNKLRLTQVLTFPVETFAMVHDGKDIIDQKYKQLCAEMYAEGHSFFTYISDSADSLASCCFSKDTKVLWKDADGQERTTSFEEFYNYYCDKDKPAKVYRNGEWHECDAVKLPSCPMYDVVVDDGAQICMTYNHINPVADSTGKVSLKQTSELKVGDGLMFENMANRQPETTYVNGVPTSRFGVKKIVKIAASDYNGDVYCVSMQDQRYPYFTLANGLITHNCRLRNELAENTFSPTSGLTGIMTGSCNVITLNISRIVQDCANVFGFDNWLENTETIKEYLTTILKRVYKYHIAYKTMLYEMEEKGMFAASNGGYIYMSKLYSTIGINGLNEAARFFGMEVSNNREYIAFLQLILGTIKEQNKLASIHDKKRPFLFNSEVVPAESLGGKNYNWDKKDGYWVPDDENLYNSYFYNAHDDTSVLDKFILHGRQTYQYTDGGSAAHINLEDHLTKEQYLKLIDFAIEKGTNYFTFNIPNSKCEDCGHIVKQPVTVCPKCGSGHITQYTRVIGYLRPIKTFGADRQLEAAKRVYSDGRSEIC